MSTQVSQRSRRRFPRKLGIAFTFTLFGVATSLVSIATQADAGPVPTAREMLGTTAGLPQKDQPPAKIIVDPPQPERLARSVVFIEYRTENLRVLPVFGPEAAELSPRIGHIHLTLDDAPWHWVDSSGGPVIVTGLTPGPHKIVFELANANHKPLAQEVVKFEVPK